MQSKTSFFNKTVFLKNLTRSWPLSLSLLTLYVLSMPVSFLLDASSSYRYGNGYNTAIGINYLYLNHIQSLIGPFLVAVEAIAAVIIIFSYLYSTKASNTIHALPLNRKALYGTGVISAVVVLALPQLVASVLMFFAGVSYGASASAYVFSWLFFQLMFDVFFVGFASCVAMVSGQAVTTAVFYGIFNFLYLGMKVCVAFFASVICVGMQDISYVLNESSFLTPVVYLAEKVNLDISYTWTESSMTELTYRVNGFSTATIYCAVGLLFGALGYYLYKNKKLETVNDFIAIDVMKHVFLIGMSFFPSIIIGAFSTAILIETAVVDGITAAYLCIVILTLLVGMVIYFICRMLIAKSFRVFTAKNWKYLACYSVAVVAFCFVMFADGFGLEKHVPKAEELKWAAVDAGYMVLDQTDDGMNEILDMQKALIKNRNELRDMMYRKESANGSWITFTYRYTNGRKVARSYFVEDPSMYSAEYASAVNNVIDYLNNPKRYKENYIAKEYMDLSGDSIEICIKPIDDEPYYENSYRYEQNKGKVEAVYTALLKDIDEGNIKGSTIFDETYDEKCFINSFCVTMASDEPIETVDSIVYGYKYKEKEVYFYPRINEDCHNTIRALVETGIIDNEDVLVSEREARKIYQ